MSKKTTMKSLTIFLIFLQVFFSVPLFSQSENAPRLIVRADDMGFSHSANAAILKTVKEGIATSIEILVPAPWFPETVKLLSENPAIDVGIHLTLTSEWSNMKFRPLTKSSSLINEDGFFYPFVWPNNELPGQALTEHQWKIEEVEQEFRAQIELALKNLPHISHVSAHMGCYYINEEVEALTKKLAKEYEIDIDPADYSVKRAGYVGPMETSEEKVQSIVKMLESLKKGATYLFVDHPGLDTPELRAIHHPGYEDVALDRQGVTDAWTDQRVIDAIKKLGIQLISYADLEK